MIIILPLQGVDLGSCGRSAVGPAGPVIVLGLAAFWNAAGRLRLGVRLLPWQKGSVHVKNLPAPK